MKSCTKRTRASSLLAAYISSRRRRISSLRSSFSFPKRLCRKFSRVSIAAISCSFRCLFETEATLTFAERPKMLPCVHTHRMTIAPSYFERIIADRLNAFQLVASGSSFVRFGRCVCSEQHGLSFAARAGALVAQCAETCFALMPVVPRHGDFAGRCLLYCCRTQATCSLSISIRGTHTHAAMPRRQFFHGILIYYLDS